MKIEEGTYKLEFYSETADSSVHSFRMALLLKECLRRRSWFVYLTESGKYSFFIPLLLINLAEDYNNLIEGPKIDPLVEDFFY